MTPAYIFKASVEAVKQGRHLHCFSAHVQGKGYINDGSLAGLEEDYKESAVQACQQEIDNMDYASAYAEPGYETVKGIFFANWNNLPSLTTDLLEKAGYSCEWSDEWITCDDCGKALRTQPDSFCWEPAYKEEDGAFLCRECCPTDEEDEEETEDNENDSTISLD